MTNVWKSLKQFQVIEASVTRTLVMTYRKLW